MKCRAMVVAEERCIIRKDALDILQAAHVFVRQVVMLQLWHKVWARRWHALRGWRQRRYLSLFALRGHAFMVELWTSSGIKSWYSCS